MLSTTPLNKSGWGGRSELAASMTPITKPETDPPPSGCCATAARAPGRVWAGSGFGALQELEHHARAAVGLGEEAAGGADPAGLRRRRADAAGAQLDDGALEVVHLE